MAKNKDKKKGPVGPAHIHNRRARYDYSIADEVEAGIMLVGSEVKSVFLGRVSLTDSFCRVMNGEMFIFNMDIEPYEKTTHFQHDRRRDRKLLMHRKEIDTLQRKSLEKGFSLVPLDVYFTDKGRVKVKIGLGRGKGEYDKRKAIAKDDTRREIERARTMRD